MTRLSLGNLKPFCNLVICILSCQGCKRISHNRYHLVERKFYYLLVPYLVAQCILKGLQLKCIVSAVGVFVAYELLLLLQWSSLLRVSTRSNLCSVLEVCYVHVYRFLYPPWFGIQYCRIQVDITVSHRSMSLFLLLTLVDKSVGVFLRSSRSVQQINARHNTIQKDLSQQIKKLMLDDLLYFISKVIRIFLF